VFQPIALAHSQETDFGMLDLEGFVGEFSARNSCFSILVFRFNLAHLNEHTFDDSVHFRLRETDLFISAFELLAKSKEVFTRFWSYSVEEFDDYRVLYAIHVEVELGEFRGRVVNLFSVDFTLNPLVVIFRV